MNAETPNTRQALTSEVLVAVLFLIALAFSLLSSSAHAAAQVQAETAMTRVYEHTFLKAKPGRRDELIRYIRLNWFEMDRKGLEAGIFTSYELYEEISDTKEWDLVMIVGYPTDKGYSDEKTQEVFKNIRRDHKEIKVNEVGLKELGEIVGNHRLRKTAG